MKKKLSVEERFKKAEEIYGQPKFRVKKTKLDAEVEKEWKEGLEDRKKIKKDNC